MGTVVDLGKNGSIMLRYGKEEDRKFIMSSWLNAFKGSYYAGPIQFNLYYKTYQEVIDRILRRPQTEVVVACLPDDEDEILGYAVVEGFGDQGPCVHWAYVKRRLRGFGIASTILAYLGVTKETEFSYSFRVRNTPSFVAKYKARFNPHLVSKKRG